MSNFNKLLVTVTATLVAVISFASFANADGMNTAPADKPIDAPYYSSGITYFGKLEHAPRIEKSQVELGARYNVGPLFDFSGKAIAYDTSTTSWKVKNFEFQADYYIGAYSNVFVMLQTDEDFDNSNYRIGVEFEY